MNTALSEQGAQLMAVLVSEWFKTARRLARLAEVAAPGHKERERAQLLYSEGRVETALAELGIRLVKHDGARFSPELPAEPVNPEDFNTEEGLVVIETLEPTVIHNGRVVARGRVVLSR